MPRVPVCRCLAVKPHRVVARVGSGANHSCRGARDASDGTLCAIEPNSATFFQSPDSDRRESVVSETENRRRHAAARRTQTDGGGRRWRRAWPAGQCRTPNRGRNGGRVLCGRNIGPQAFYNCVGGRLEDRRTPLRSWRPLDEEAALAAGRIRLSGRLIPFEAQSGPPWAIAPFPTAPGRLAHQVILHGPRLGSFVIKVAHRLAWHPRSAYTLQ